MESHHPETSWGKRLFIPMVMNLIIPAVQIIVGTMAGSMALISYAALKVGKRGPTPSLSFGYRE